MPSIHLEGGSILELPFPLVCPSDFLFTGTSYDTVEIPLNRIEKVRIGGVLLTVPRVSAAIS